MRKFACDICKKNVIGRGFKGRWEGLVGVDYYECEFLETSLGIKDMCEACAYKFEMMLGEVKASVAPIYKQRIKERVIELIKEYENGKKKNKT